MTTTDPRVLADTCATCRYSAPSFKALLGRDAIKPDGGRVFCRRYPPSQPALRADVETFPMVFDTEWCGEHQLNPGAPTPAELAEAETTRKMHEGR